MIFVRYILIGLIIILFVRSFVRPRNIDEAVRGPKVNPSTKQGTKGVSKKVGEYVDYEDVDS